MYSNIYKRGLTTYAGIAIAAVVLVVGGIIFYNMQPEEEIMKETGEAMMEEGEKMMEEGEAMMGEGEKMMEDSEAMMEGSNDGDAMMEENGHEGDAMMEGGDGMMEGEAMMEKETSFSGTVLAGTSSQLLEFNKADYDKAVASGKLVTLYFYANWCPLCKAEFPKAEAAFDELATDQVVGFRVHYKDGADTDEMQELAREFGVSSQHTKIFIKNGERILKSPEIWDKEQYLTEINNILN